LRIAEWDADERGLDGFFVDTSKKSAKIRRIRKNLRPILPYKTRVPFFFATCPWQAAYWE